MHPITPLVLFATLLLARGMWVEAILVSVGYVLGASIYLLSTGWRIDFSEESDPRRHVCGEGGRRRS